MTRVLEPSALKCPATNKQSYADERTAQEHMAKVYTKEQRDKTPVRVYRCEECGWWHMTARRWRD